MPIWVINKREEGLMKKRFAKSLLCLSLVGAMMLADVSPAMAAAPTEEVATETVDEATTETEEVVEATTEATEEVAEETEEVTEAVTEEVTTEEEELLNDEGVPYISSYNISNTGESLYCNWSSANSAEFKVYVNDKLFLTTTATDMALGLDNGAVYGGSYVIKVVPIAEDGTVGTPVTFSKQTLTKVSVSEFDVYSDYDRVQGYPVKYLYLSFDVNNGYNRKLDFEVQRRIGKKGKWVTIGIATKEAGNSYGNYADTTAVPGKKYDYRVRYISKADKFINKTTVYGAFSNIVKNCQMICDYFMYGGLALDEKGKLCVNIGNEYGYMGADTTGYELYRSTNKSKGYKKIATSESGYFTDKSISSTGTYFYKVRPYYFNRSNHKKYYFPYTTPYKVVVEIGGFSAWVNHTGNNQLTVSWDKCPGATEYTVYMKKNVTGAAYKQVLKTSKLTATFKNLSSDTNYSFYVVASRKMPNGSKATTSSVADKSTGLTAPENLYAKHIKTVVKSTTATCKFKMTWDRVYGAKSIVIKAYDAKTGQDVVLKKLAVTARAYTMTVAKIKNSYGSYTNRYSNIRVCAVSGDVEAPAYMSYVPFTLPGTIKVKCKKSGSNSIKISWSKINKADTYFVTRYNPNGSCITYSTTKTSYIDKDVAPGVKYFYTVSAKNTKFDIVTGQFFGKNITIKASAPKLEKIQNLAKGQATLKWKKMDYASKYEIYRATSKTGKYAKVKTTSSTTFVDKNLKKNKTYYYKIKAYGHTPTGKKINSGFSNVQSIKITK